MPHCGRQQARTRRSGPDFLLEYLDLIEMSIQPARLADSAGTVRLLTVMNSLRRPICQQVTQRWEAYRARLPPTACLYTISMDPPGEQAGWQTSVGVLHQLLSAQRGEQFGWDYGVWLQRAVFVIDQDDRLVYAVYVADQLCEPDYITALHTVLQAAGQ